MPRDRLTGRRGVGRPGIQAGGFAGGTYVRPAAPEESQLTQLGNALAGVSQGVNSAIYQREDNLNRKAQLQAQEIAEEQRRKNAQDVLLQDEAEKKAQVVRAKMQGMTEQALSDYMVSEEMQAEVRDNPYLLPAINKYRGQRAAQGIWQSASEQVDVMDDEQWTEFLANNTPEDVNDEAFAAGFNGYMAGVENQRTQSQVAANTTRIKAERLEMASAAFTESLLQGSDFEADLETLYADPVFNGMSPAERTEVQRNGAIALAESGRMEDLKAFLETPRGSAPSLMKADPALAARLIDVAAGVQAEADNKLINEKYADMMRMVNSGGATFKQVEARYGDVLNALTPIQRVNVEQRIDDARRQAQEDALKATIRAEVSRAENVQLSSAVADILGTRGGFNGLDRTIDYTDEDGDQRQVKITVNEMTEEAQRVFQEAFPEGLFTDDPEQRAQMSEALVNMNANNVTLPPQVRAQVNLLSQIVTQGELPEGFSPERLELAIDNISSLPGSVATKLDGTGAVSAQVGLVREGLRMGLSPADALSGAQRTYADGLSRASTLRDVTRNVTEIVQLVPASDGGKVALSEATLEALMKNDPVRLPVILQNAAAGGTGSRDQIKDILGERLLKVNGRAVIAPIVGGKPEPRVVSEWSPAFAYHELGSDFVKFKKRSGTYEWKKDVVVEVIPAGPRANAVKVFREDDPEGEHYFYLEDVQEFSGAGKRLAASNDVVVTQSGADERNEIDDARDVANSNAVLPRVPIAPIY